MELTAEAKLISSQHYSPTSTPVLYVFRPLPPRRKENLSAGEYFLASSVVILALIGISSLRTVVAWVTANPRSYAYWAALLAPIAAGLFAAAVHEAGHLLSGAFFGFKLRQIRFGSVHLGKHATCGEPYCGGVITLGRGVLEPRVSPEKDNNLQRRLALLVAGGPLANLLFAAALQGLLAFFPPNFV